MRIFLTMAKEKKTVISIHSYALILLICFKSFLGIIVYQITYSAEKSEIKNVDFWAHGITFSEKKTGKKEVKKAPYIFTTFWNSFWQLLQKMMLRAQKLTFLSFDFFAESRICHTSITWKDLKLFQMMSL